MNFLRHACTAVYRCAVVLFASAHSVRAVHHESIHLRDRRDAVQGDRRRNYMKFVGRLFLCALMFIALVRASLT
jgi:hypothetical protein